MTSSSHQDNSPYTPEPGKVTDKGICTITQPELSAKVARLPSTSSNISKALERTQHFDAELSASFSGSLSLGSPLIPLPVTFSQAEYTQDPPILEDVVTSLRMQRLADYKQAVYIPPSAKPSLQAKDDTLFPLMEKVEDFLAGDGQVMLVLGDSGAGKSTFNRYLEHQLWQDYRADGPIPLFINLPALDRPDKELVTEHLRRLDFPDELIWALKQTRCFILICDGYDESQLTCNLHTTNLLNQSGQWKAKLVVTCRTQFLGPNYRDRFEPQGEGYYSSAPGLFKESVIAPFSSDQVEEYVERYISLETRAWAKKDYMEKLTTIPGLMGLVKNPFLLSLALGALPAVAESKYHLSSVHVTRVQLYDSFVQHWLSANKRRLRNQNLKLSQDEQRTLDELLDDGFEDSVIKFQMGLAAAIFQEQEGRPVVDYDHRRDRDSWKRAFFNTDLDTSLLRDASLLIRAGKLYRFIHRSLLEYFYSCIFCPPIAIDNEFAPHGLSDSVFVLPSIADHPLSKRSIVMESSIVLFLAERVQIIPEFKRQLHAFLERSKTDKHASQAAANAITILIRAGVQFNGADLRGVRIPGADLSGGQFDSVHLEAADLTDANLIKCWIRQADFTNARMDGVQLGLQLLSGSYGTSVQLWSIEAGLSEYILKADSTHARAVAFSPCGNQVAFASDNEFVILWDIHTSTAMFVLVTGSIFGVSYSPDGARIATGGKDGAVRVFDTQTGLLMWDLESRHMSIHCIDYSPNGQWIITGHNTGELELWDTSTGELCPKWIGHNGYVTGINFSPNSKWIASSSFDRTVKLWDAQTRVLVSMFAGHSEIVYSVAFSPDGLQLASSGWDKTVRLWEVHSRGTGHDSHSSFDSVFSVAYSPDGGHLVSGSKNGTIRQYNANTGEQEMDLSFGPYQASHVVYSPDGLYIITAKDNDLTLWDASTGLLILTFSSHTDIINTVAFSPCGYWIAAGSNDMTIVLWEVESGEQSPCHSHRVVAT
ncbi:WD_REPEATS_REGION domain-containing protein [Linnemannia gamsii]|uniref:WD_REPEATS_REGION domain-containing protein n=1 Tax=Linnemannia gamsii TaxID=64522 RepID=A0A9P6UJ58_9FUNG|nr:WD_REPEATS_REGION domain-containing protein [Linnemannia gamsii]